MKKRIVIADDHKLFIEWIATLLSSTGEEMSVSLIAPTLSAEKSVPAYRA